jgi:hypothetical protein
MEARTDTKWLVVHPADQFDPVASPQNIAWGNWDGSALGVGVFDLSDLSESQPDVADGVFLSAGGEWITWYVDTGAAYRIEAYDTLGDTHRVITTNAAQDARAEISEDGTGIVWQERDGSSVLQLYILDLTNPASVPVAIPNATGYNRYDPDIDRTPTDGLTVVWWENGSGSPYVRCWAQGYGSVEGVSNGSEPAINWNASYSRVVWMRDGSVRRCNASLWRCTGSYAGCVGTIVSGGSSVHRNPDVSSRLIVWESDMLSPGYFDVFAYDLSTYGIYLMNDDGPGPVQQLHPRAQGTRAVWEDRRFGNSDIFQFVAAPPL